MSLCSDSGRTSLDNLIGTKGGGESVFYFCSPPFPDSADLTASMERHPL